MMDADAAPPVMRRDFALCTGDGEKRFAFSLEDEGVTLDARGLVWTSSGAARAKTFGETAAIRLRRNPICPIGCRRHCCPS